MSKKRQLVLALVAFFVPAALFAQKTITGSVTDSAGLKLSSVSIVLPGTTKGVTSDENGRFSISVPENSSSLQFSLVGYQALTVDLGGKTDLSVVLHSTSANLNDVVVVGYGVQRKRDVTGTIASIKGDAFKNLPISSGAQALQGRAAGVDIVRSDGSPGSAPNIRIRGVGTINNSDPLIVIDGVPAGSLSDVNPNDIESMDVLKDASASAIYGTRAANGVILVTTKKGSFGSPTKISVNAYTGTSKEFKYLNLLTAPDLAKLKTEAYTNDSLAVPGIWSDPYYSTQRTDWQRALLGKGKTQNADFAVRGGGPTSNYSISGNYYNETGLVPNTYFSRYSTRINSEHRFMKIFKFGENFLWSATSGTTTDTRSTQTGTLWSALRFNPAIPVRNADGSWGTSKADNQLGDINNPVFTATAPNIRNRTVDLLANAYLEAEIIKGLTLKANIGYSLLNFNGYAFSPAEPNQTRSIQLSTVSQGEREATSTLEEYTLNYTHTFATDHSINFTGGYSAQIFRDRNFGAFRNGYDDTSASQRFLNNGNPAYQFNNGTMLVNHGLESGFGRINYAYKGRYLFTGTLRADASSRFPADRRWGYFPAFSAGWRISDENFFKNAVHFVDELKLTGGYGELGNQEIPELQYLAIIGTGLNYNFGDAPVQGTGVTSLANPNITWERAQMANVALEFGLLDHQLTGSVAYFNKNTADMLIPYPLTETYGTAGVPNQNVGKLNNRGVEVDLTYRGQAGAFTYSIGANASFIKNKVTLLYGDNKTYIGSILYGRELLETSRTYQGQPISSFFGFKTNGLYQTQADIDNDPNVKNDDKKGNIRPGDVRFLDQNGDGVVDENDRVYLGNPNPKAVFGINGSAGFKGFDLSFSFAGVTGVSLYNADRVSGLNSSSVFNWYADQLNRWHGAGTSNSVPRLSRVNANNNYRSSDMWVENGSYLALKNISLGYSFTKLRLLETDISAVRVYVACYNAFYLTGYSGFTPELGLTDGNRQRGVDVAQYPSARSFTFGASINF